MEISVLIRKPTRNLAKLFTCLGKLDNNPAFYIQASNNYYIQGMMVGIHEHPKCYRCSAVHTDLSTKTSIKLHIYKKFPLWCHSDEIISFGLLLCMTKNVWI